MDIVGLLAISRDLKNIQSLVTILLERIVRECPINYIKVCVKPKLIMFCGLSQNRPFQMRAWSCKTVYPLRGLPYLAYDNVNLAMVNSMMLRSSMLAFEKVYYQHFYEKLEDYIQWWHQNFFVGGIRGQNAFLRGKKSKNLQKMTDFGHSFSSDLGESGGGGRRASNWGKMSPCPP